MVKLKTLGIGALAVIVSYVGCPHLDHLSRHTYTATVTDKQPKRLKNKDIYMVFTKLPNGKPRVFVDRDSPLEWKFNSSDIYATLENGKTFEIRAYGWRIPFFSSYENIVKVTQVSPNQNTQSQQR